MSSKLEDQLVDFDGVTVSKLSEIRAECHQNPSYTRDVIRLCTDLRANVSIGATWLLKAAADRGGHFNSLELKQLIDGLEDIEPWESKLHICQSIDAFSLTPDQERVVFEWARKLTDHSRPFVRAWSVHVLVTIGVKSREFRSIAKVALEKALEDPAASVRARARNLRRQKD